MLKVLDKEQVSNALTLEKSTNQGFADSYIAVTAKAHELSVATFNRRNFEMFDVPLYDLKDR